jgi:hypothetical protein
MKRFFLLLCLVPFFCCRLGTKANSAIPSGTQSPSSPTSADGTGPTTLSPAPPQTAPGGPEAASATIASTSTSVEAPTPLLPAAGGDALFPTPAAPPTDPNSDDPNALNPNHLVNFGKADPTPSYNRQMVNSFVPEQVYSEDDNGYPDCEHPPQVDFGYNDRAANCPSTAIGVQLPMQGYCHINYGYPINLYASNPPASGDHWPSPSHALGVNSTPIAREYYIHSMEHGAVILAYNCPNGCPYELGVLQQVVGARADARFKVIMTPDPLMPANSFAAISWSWLYLFAEPEFNALVCFIDQHYDHARENDRVL